MRTRFTQAPGVSYRAISLQTGNARGVEIDNPSGSWLYIPSLETFVPPYVVGWSYGFPIAIAALDIIAGDGPAGQVGTDQGDPTTVYLTDEPIVTSEGSPSKGDIVKPLATSTVNQIEFRTEVELPVVIVNGTGPGSSKIMRLYSFRIMASLDDVVGLPDLPFEWLIRYDPVPFPAPPQGTDFAFGIVSPENGYEDFASFDVNPLDIPLDFNVALLVQGFWRNNSLNAGQVIAHVSYTYHLRYSVI